MLILSPEARKKYILQNIISMLKGSSTCTCTCMMYMYTYTIKNVLYIHVHAYHDVYTYYMYMYKLQQCLSGSVYNEQSKNSV